MGCTSSMDVEQKNLEQGFEGNDRKLRDRYRAVDYDTQDCFHKDDIPDLVAAIILSLRLSNLVKDHTEKETELRESTIYGPAKEKLWVKTVITEEKNTGLEDDNGNGKSEENLWEKTADNKYDFLPLLLKVLSLISYREGLAIGREILMDALKDFYEHTAVLNWMASVAVTLNGLQMYKQAIEIYRYLIKAEILTRGSNDEVLNLRVNLSNALQESGNYLEAYNQQMDILNLNTELLGANHPDNLLIKNNLANTISSMGDHERALQLFREVLGLRIKILGKKHPTAIMTKQTVGNDLRNLQRIDEAIKVHFEVLDVAREVLGPDHTLTLKSASILQQI